MASEFELWLNIVNLQGDRACGEKESVPKLDWTEPEESGQGIGSRKAYWRQSK